VGDSIEVLSKRSSDKTGNLWVSDGSGSFEISEVSDVDF
jgi:HSP90 family molecular chaperone